MRGAGNAVVWVVAGCLAGIFACASKANVKATQPPGDLIARYRQAVANDDSDLAYQLLSKRAQRDISRATFAKWWKHTRKEQKYQAERLEMSGRENATPTERASLTYSDGFVALLESSQAGWRLVSPPVFRLALLSPYATAQALLQNLKSAPFAHALELFSKTKQSNLKPTLDDFLRSLAHELSNPKTSMTFDDATHAILEFKSSNLSYRISFQKEHGSWRIDDIDVVPRNSVDPIRETPN